MPTWITLFHSTRLSIRVILILPKTKRRKTVSKTLFCCHRTSEGLGNPVYPPVCREFAERGVDCAGKTARLLIRGDYQRYDLLIGMDDENMWDMCRSCDRKIHPLMEYAGRPGSEIADPWYTRDFKATWRDVESGCKRLLAVLYDPK